MNIVRATPSDLDRIRRLLQRGRHTFQNLGREDWHNLLAHGVVMLGATGGGLFTGETGVSLLGVRPEARPSTLPNDAPSRVYVVCATVARGRSATADMPALIEAAVDVLRDEDSEHSGDHGWQLVYYDADNWLVRPLLAGRFEQVDRVQFLELPQLSRRVGEIRERLGQSVAEGVDDGGRYGTITLRLAQTGDVERLARLDGETFDPLWHMDARHLLELLITCHVCVATLGEGPSTQGEAERLVGYAALCGPQPMGAQPGEAMLARLAVHPTAQGRGIGRRLLMDSLSAAHARGAETVVLNTQTSNARSQTLYRSLGFRRTGEIYPVLTRNV